MIMIFWGVVLTSLVCLTLILKTLNEKRPSLPGPRGLPILGSLLSLDAEAPYLTLSEWAKEYGKIFSLRLGGLPCVVLSDPEQIKKAFFKTEVSGRAPLYLTHGLMKGRGLICAEGDLWKSQRRFVKEFLRRLHADPALKERIDAAAEDSLREAAMKEEWSSVEFEEELGHTIGNMMNEIIFGNRYARGDLLWKKLLYLRGEGAKKLAVAGPVNFLPWIRYFLPSVQYAISWAQDGQEFTHKEYARIVEEISRDLESRDDNLTKEFIKHALKGEDYFTYKQLYVLQADMFGAGTDTSLTIILWCILYLCLYPEEMQNRLREEAMDENDDEKPIPYFQAFINEVQRLYPVVPLGVPHGTTEETEIDGWRIPKGCMVIALHWDVNRNPELWENPNEFHPERFLKDGEFKKPDYFTPFQVGRRRCVGENFGEDVVYLFLKKLVMRFKINFTEESSRNYNVNQKHDHGFTLVPKPFSFKLSPVN